MGNAMLECRAEMQLRFLCVRIAGERLDLGIVDAAHCDAEASVDGRAADPSKNTQAHAQSATRVEGVFSE